MHKDSIKPAWIIMRAKLLIKTVLVLAVCGLICTGCGKKKVVATDPHSAEGVMVRIAEQGRLLNNAPIGGYRAVQSWTRTRRHCFGPAKTEIRVVVSAPASARTCLNQSAMVALGADFSFQAGEGGGRVAAYV